MAASHSCIPVRATYENLYKGPESDAKFLRSVSSNGRGRDTHDPSPPPLMRSLSTNCCLNAASQPRVVDSISSRQIYLRSYSFSRKESMPQKVKNCASRIKRSVSMRAPNRKDNGGAHGGIVVIRKAMNAVFRRLLSFSTKVDVLGSS
ncbi:hypothetical protein AgCh_034542 [Apium graveolens]